MVKIVENQGVRSSHLYILEYYFLLIIESIIFNQYYLRNIQKY